VRLSGGSLWEGDKGEGVDVLLGYARSILLWNEELCVFGKAYGLNEPSHEHEHCEVAGAFNDNAAAVAVRNTEHQGAV